MEVALGDGYVAGSTVDRLDHLVREQELTGIHRNSPEFTGINGNGGSGDD